MPARNKNVARKNKGNKTTKKGAPVDQSLEDANMGSMNTPSPRKEKKEPASYMKGSDDAYKPGAQGLFAPKNKAKSKSQSPVKKK